MGFPKCRNDNDNFKIGSSDSIKAKLENTTLGS